MRKHQLKKKGKNKTIIKQKKYRHGKKKYRTKEDSIDKSKHFHNYNKYKYSSQKTNFFFIIIQKEV